MKLYSFIIFSCLIMFSCENCPNVTQLCNPNAEYIDSVAGKKVDLYLVKNTEESIDCSKELNKPILTVYHCEIVMSCRYVLYEMFENDQIHELVEQNFILNFLSVCDKTKLAEPYAVEYNGTEWELETVGDVNVNRELVKYKRNTQPIYAITDFNDQDMVEHLTYSGVGKKHEGFITFLETGLKEFNKLHN